MCFGYGIARVWAGGEGGLDWDGGGLRLVVMDEEPVYLVLWCQCWVVEPVG